MESIPHQNFTISYLGTSLRGNPQSKNFCQKTIGKIDRKLNGLKYNQISKGGRLTLINSFLASTPNYLLCLFKAPTIIYKQIKKLWRNFLWNGTDKDMKNHILNWDLCTIPKSYGGLGITKVKDTNLAFLNKWLWTLEEIWPSMSV